MPAGGRGHGALPVETSSFIGRADELARIQDATGFCLETYSR